MIKLIVIAKDTRELLRQLNFSHIFLNLLSLPSSYRSQHAEHLRHALESKEEAQIAHSIFESTDL